ncbi:uncharacterized protein LOC119727260 [Patiria miniata]|uniref:Uncharacterized protein n=1 Tax=Patiria miniata TaxID=46514 RepID=A0A913ZTX5_PATMI|nr:uncharacterized protein LOC119727260 [Patiria miniata]
MAIVNRCCCADNVRAGSALSAFYTVISCTVFLGFAAAQLKSYVASFVLFNLASNTEADLLFMASSSYVALLSWIIVCSVLVLWGTAKDNRWFLLPYMITMPVLILVQLASIIFIIVVVLGGSVYYFGSAYVYVVLGVQTLLMALNVSCFLTVTSQYQELRDGRGTIDDVRGRTTNTNHQPFGGILAQQAQGFPMQGQPLK